MAGRKRRGRPQGIRKKKSKTTSQTLARVADRKEANDQKLQRKLSDVNARRQHNPSSLHNPQQAVLQNLLSQATETDPRKLEFMHRQDNAYQILMQELEQPIIQPLGQKVDTDCAEQVHSQHDLQLSNDMATSDIQSEQELEHEHEHEEPVTLPETMEEEPVDEEPIETGSSDEKGAKREGRDVTVDQQNFAAAIRENKHFGTSVIPSTVPEKASTVCTIKDVVKISAALPEEKRESVHASLNNIDSITIKDLGLQPSVYARWQAIKAANPKSKDMSAVEKAFLCSAREYSDVSLSKHLSFQEEDGVRDIYAAHVVSHVLRARNRVLRNDTALRKEDVCESDSLKFKDQGFSRARVLIMVPMRNVAYEVVNTILALSAKASEEGEKSTPVAYRQRFEEEFAPDEDDERVPQEDSEAGKTKAAKLADAVKKRTEKPADYRRTFRGNIDDDFKLGISFSKSIVKLYSDFYSSDIIVTSPLGLSRTMAEKASNGGKHTFKAKRKNGEEEDTEWKTNINAAPRKTVRQGADYDFLSSIEICVIDGADVFSMQNWDTLRTMVNMSSKMPVDTRETDFSRVRDWCLENTMSKFKQTMLISKYQKSDFVAMMRGCSNHSGTICMTEPSSKRGILSDVVVSLRQTFIRVEDVSSPLSSPDRRFEYFCRHVLPMIQSTVDSQVLLVVPDYFDYVRVRNKLVKVCATESGMTFASMCEYSKGGDISRARSRLFDRTVGLVVMTERFHFFWRHWLRGAEHVIWYGLPENGRFYSEIVNMTAEAGEKGRATKCVALFDRFDGFRLSRIVGSGRGKRMMVGENSTFLFV